VCSVALTPLQHGPVLISMSSAYCALLRQQSPWHFHRFRFLAELETLQKLVYMFSTCIHARRSNFENRLTHGLECVYDRFPVTKRRNKRLNGREDAPASDSGPRVVPVLSPYLTSMPPVVSHRSVLASFGSYHIPWLGFSIRFS
jgi:hypothetical protein